MSGYILAIDQGTSSTKAIVFREDGTVASTVSSPLNTAYGAEGTAEQDPRDIYQSVIQAANGAVEQLETEHHVSYRTAITCAGISNQRETFVLWDKDGVPFYNAVVWQCKRSVDICSELAQRGFENEIRTRTGLIIDPYFSGSKAMWLLRNVPHIKEAHDRGEVLFGTIDSWLLYRLTGGAIHACDHTNASRTLLFNIQSLSWDEELINILEVPRLRLPEIHPSAHNYGESDFDGVFPSAVPITALIGDSHSSFFGSACYDYGGAKATLGTGCSILLNVGNTPPPPYPSTMATIGFSLHDRLDYALEGIIVSAGSVLTWLQRELELYDDPGELEHIAASLPDSGGVVIVPGHAGLGAPFWKMDAKGAIHGLTFGSRKGHILRAALEAIAYQIRAILDAVKEESSIGCRSLRVDGGISINVFAIRWIADTLGVPIHTFEFPDITARGAALLAGIGAGIYSGIDEVAALGRNESIHEPGSGAETANQGYAVWREVVDSIAR